MVGNRRYGWLGLAMLPVKALDTLQPIYGLVAFAILVLVPFVGNHLITSGQKTSVQNSVELTGAGLLVVVVTLTVMITPIMIALICEALAAAPRSWREGAVALGLNPLRAMLAVTLRAIRPAIVAAAGLPIARKAALCGDQLINLILHCTAADEFVNEHVALLADAEGPIGRLVFDGGVPPAVEVDDVAGSREVQPRATGLEREHEERGTVFALKALDESSPLSDGGPAMKHEARSPEDAFEEPGQRLGDLAKLRKDEYLFLPLGQFLQLA